MIILRYHSIYQKIGGQVGTRFYGSANRTIEISDTKKMAGFAFYNNCKTLNAVLLPK
jgi:hypothetical protein